MKVYVLTYSDEFYDHLHVGVFGSEAQVNTHIDKEKDELGTRAEDYEIEEVEVNGDNLPDGSGSDQGDADA
jgi:hypothetical protein